MENFLQDKELGRFLTLPDEELLIAQRRHWFTLAVPLLLFTWFFLFFLTASFLLFVSVFNQPLFFVFAASLLFLFFMTSVTKTIVDWYLHFYIITNKKIIEVACTTLFSHTVFEVLLDQVRCTEIDVRKNGLINQLIDKGDVIITFDRPTHEEEFIFADIADPYQMGSVLADAFSQMEKTSQGHWLKSRNRKGLYYLDTTSHIPLRGGGEVHGSPRPHSV